MKIQSLVSKLTSNNFQKKFASNIFLKKSSKGGSEQSGGGPGSLVDHLLPLPFGGSVHGQNNHFGYLLCQFQTAKITIEISTFESINELIAIKFSRFTEFP